MLIIHILLTFYNMYNIEKSTENMDISNNIVQSNLGLYTSIKESIVIINTKIISVISFSF